MDRPYVICHMCTTIDGKILSKRWGKLPGPKSSINLFETTAASFGIGAWIVGTTTMREFSGKQLPLKKSGRVPAGDFVANPKAKTLAIGLDVRAALRWQQNEVAGDHVVLLITEQAGNDYRAHLRTAGVSYLICGRTDVDLHVALHKLRTLFNLKKLMAQGGGKFNGSMLHAGLSDEISQVIVPIADGGVGVSSMFDIPGDAPKISAATLKPMSHKTLPGGVHWLRYRVIHKHKI